MSYSIVMTIAAIWLVINVANVVFKTWMPYEFQQTLQSFGLTIRPVQIMFQTQSLNRLFYVLSNCRPKLINKWFALGTVVTLSAVLPSIYLLIQTLYSLIVANYFNGNRVATKAQALYPVVSQRGITCFFCLNLFFPNDKSLIRFLVSIFRCLTLSTILYLWP